MGLVWLILAIAVLFALASFGRKQKQREVASRIRRHFPPLARMRLVAACPGLDDRLDEASLRMIFDWILIQMYRRTGTSGFGELMQWSIEKGETEARRLTGEVTHEAVDRLPQPVLEIIDRCQGRTFAGVLFDEALTEAGQRALPPSGGDRRPR